MINIDALLKNADWPKRTPDKTEDLEAVQKWEEAKHPRGRGGRFVPTVSITVGGREIAMVKPKRAYMDKMVLLDVAKVDASLALSPSFYVGPGGKGAAIGTRYEQFGKFIETTDESIETPEMYVNSEGVAMFTNGRHRWAWLRDHGVTAIPVAMEGDGVENARKHGYLVAKKWDESQHPRDSEGQFTAVVTAVTRMMKLTDLLGLPRAQFVTPDGEIYRGPSGASHQEAAKSIGLTIEEVIKSGVVRVIVHGGKVEGFSVGGPITHAQADLIVGLAQDTLAVDVLTGTPDDPNADGGAGYVGRSFEGRWVNPTAVRNWVNNQFRQSVAKQEYKFGNTQIEIDPHSTAALSLNAARDSIRDEDLMAAGKDVDPNHVTVRYGLLNADVDALRSFIAKQSPFEAYLGSVMLFPASGHSDGAVPVVAQILSPALKILEQEIGKHADFKEKNFPVYKPHCTLAYCKPDASEVYADLKVQGSFMVTEITISHASGVKETILFGMAQKWDESKHRRQPSGSSRGGEFAYLHGVSDALHAALNGESVNIDRANVTKFLERLGEQEEDVNLTQVQVEGMKIFGGEGLGIPREEMPQIPKEHRLQFLKEMKVLGITITREHVNPLDLKPTQKFISAQNVVGKIQKYAKGDRAFPPLLVSKEGRILDGHHHWGVMAALATEASTVEVPVYRLNISVKKALALMHAYDKKYGIKRKTSSDIKVKKWDESQHPRDKEGQFTSIAQLQEKYGEIIPTSALFAGREHNREVMSQFDKLDQSKGGVPTTLDPRELFATQEDFDVTGLTHYQEGTGQEKKNPVVVKSGGKYYVANGHHRAAIAILQEKAGLLVEVYDVDATKKLDASTGRYVTPFVSFDRQGEKQLQLIASLNSSRLATWGFTAEAEVLGMARYRISAVLDGRTSDFCRMISGKIFEVQDARRKVIEVLNVQDPNDLRTVQPWPKQTKQALAEFEEMDAEELTALGFHIPPYHPNCRTICRPVSSSEGELTETTPTIPADAEVFQPVTADDLAELGIDATPEQVDDWNENVGMTPVELLSKFSGMPPQEVMTKPLGVGQNPIRFTEEGIGFNVRGADPQGVEFKLQAILEPFTGTYYLTQADLLAGSPKAELGFLKNMFSALIEMGEKSSATSIAVGVAGNAPYYAKMGFLPDELEWESLRGYALSEVEAGSLVDVMQSLAPEDQELVKHLLQDKSVGAMSALVELPFTYEDKTIGEWLFGDASGTWALDLEDEMLVEQAKAYLS